MKDLDSRFCNGEEVDSRFVVANVPLIELGLGVDASLVVGVGVAALDDRRRDVSAGAGVEDNLLVKAGAGVVESLDAVNVGWLAGDVEPNSFAVIAGADDTGPRSGLVAKLCEFRLNPDSAGASPIRLSITAFSLGGDGGIMDSSDFLRCFGGVE